MKTLREVVLTAVIQAIWRNDPCPFCLARTGSEWPYCVHFAPCPAKDLASPEVIHRRKTW